MIVIIVPLLKLYLVVCANSQTSMLGSLVTLVQCTVK
jgi:hypothetical protein